MKKLLFIIPLLAAMIASAQQIRVTGKVVEEGRGEPLTGASVVIQETGNTTTTDSEGVFTITAETGQTLKVVFVGFQTFIQKLNANQSDLTIALQSESKTLDQVVVTGYQTQKKANLTGAVTVVDVAELKKMPNNNPIQALQGRVPGVVVYTDGSPSGGNTGVLIRGVTSINGGSPLYVIDGVPTKGGMHELNPNDIETMQVLKDAASASVYGARAANGVIVITTKRAKRGELSINAGARRSYSSYPTKLDVLNTEEYGRAYWTASATDAAIYGDNVKNSYLGIYNFDWSKNAAGNYELNKITLPEYIDPAKTMRSANTNWFDQISQTGISQTYDVSVSRGSEKGGTVLTLDYTKNEGIVRTSEFRRISGRINSDYKLMNDRLAIGESFTANATRGVDANVLNAALQALPVVPVHTVSGGWGGPTSGMNDRQNPVRLLEDNDQNNYNFLRLLGSAYADLTILKHLHLKSVIGIDYANFTKRDMQVAYVSGYLNDPVNAVRMDNNNSTKLTWTNSLNYKRLLGQHNIDAFAGTEIFREDNMDFFARRTNFLLENPDYMVLGAGTGNSTTGGGAFRARILSYIGNVNYSFADKYLASAGLRYDGSSRFGKNKQFGLFPAFSLGWKLSNENFIRNNAGYVSSLKLRYSYGENGNQDNVDATSNRTLYTTNYGGTSYSFNGAGGTLPAGYVLVQQSNDDVRWETTSQSNVGLDFGFLDEKLYGSFDYFVKKTSDMLIRAGYIGVIGEGGSRWVNGASLTNRGSEFILGYKGRMGAALSFDINGNIGIYRNEITELPDAVVNTYGGNGTTDNILGRSWGSLYGYVADGLFSTQAEVMQHAEQNGKALGRIRYKDLDGNGTVDSRDRTWIFNPTPDFSYGLNFNFGFKGFDLSMFFQGVGNQQINVFDVKSQTDFWNINETGSNKGVRLLNAWSPTNTGSSIPALTLRNDNDERRFSTYYVENGAYMKLRNLQLGYDIPKRLSSRVMISNLNLYVSGQNLFTLKSKSFTGVDPEAAGFGYPIPTMFTSGIRATF